MTEIYDLILGFAQLGGIAALVAAIVSVFKVFGLVKDGDAGKWAAALNLIALGVLVGLRLGLPGIAIAEVDNAAAQIAGALVVILGYVVQLGASAWAYDVYARLELPIIGYSHSD
jgi:hypothetical protein